jgi:hypothetical protein
VQELGKLIGKRAVWREALWCGRWGREGDERTLAGRVEDWRGIPKVQPSRFSPFPLGVPQ